MASFGTEFFNTGKGSAVSLPGLDSIERASQRRGELSVKGAELSYQKKMHDREAFKKLLQLDPATALSTKLAQDQATELDAYNNKWAQRYTQAKGELSFADQIDMQKDRSMLMAKQKKMIADQEQLLQAKGIIDKDTRRFYDRNNFNAKYNHYIETGELPTGLLIAAPQDVKSYLSKLPKTAEWGEEKQEPITDESGNVRGQQIVPYEYKATREQAQHSIADAIFQNEGMTQTIINDFDRLTPDEQLKYLKDYDSNGNHKIDPQEAQYAYAHMDKMENPIVQWAINNEDYLAPAMGKVRGTPKNLPSQGKGLTIAFGGANQHILPARQRNMPVNYGGIEYTGTYNLNGIKNKNIPLTGAKKLISGTRYDIQGGGSIEGDLLEYDPEKDVVLVSNSSTAPSPYLKSNDKIEIPADNIEGINNLPIMIGSRQSTIGELRGSKPAKPKQNKVDIGL